MDNVRSVLHILFEHMPVDQILKENISYNNIPFELFRQLANEYMPYYSNDEIFNMYNYLKNELKWMKNRVFNRNDDGQTGTEINVYDVLYLFGGMVLMEENGEPVCQYIHFLRWHDMVRGIGEDSLVTSYLACQDSLFQRERSNFFWKPVIGHNSQALNRIMEKGIAENHFHLKGSAPLFHLSWISLMNDVTNEKFREQLQRYDKRRMRRNMRYIAGYGENSLYHLYLKAACIRIYLFRNIMGIESDDFIQQMHEYLYNDVFLETRVGEIEAEIEYLRENYGTRYDYTICMDTLIENPNHHLNEILSGERWFMYSIFYKIYSHTKVKTELYNLFYAYLVIKNTIRAEMVQINDNVGFDNFYEYQERKEDFIENTIYEEVFVRMAVRDTMMNQHIHKLEARIAPRNTARETYDYIKKMDARIWEKYKEEGGQERKKMSFYVIHFIKEHDGSNRYDVGICRHHEKREQVRQQAWAIAQMREEAEKEVAERLRGIDASSSEIWCRPEVFGQAFRYLKAHKAENGLHNLRATFHVGEDFLDVTDGLRAIDEAINFLNLKCGDRLGHALALGINVREWYETKLYRLLISRLSYLDNLVWLYGKIRKYRLAECEDAMRYIEKRYDELVRTIYGMYISDAKADFSINTYYEAWKLRGDNPECYRNIGSDNAQVILDCDCSGNKKWDYYSINREFPDNYKARYNYETVYLYYLYHYSPAVKRAGDEVIEVYANESVVHALVLVQKRMQMEICQKGIGIETNPSSNCYIGSFKRYDKHPIVSWYNIGLTNNEKNLMECPQILVSINTDDQGVFHTYLENEYAYMALALEKLKKEDGSPLYKRTMILRWLDNIREIGMDQSFL